MSHATHSSILRPGKSMTLGLVSLALGMFFNPMFFAVALGLVGISIASHPGSRIFGYGISALAVVFLALQLGYDVGKDMAYRDNAMQASSSTDAP